MSEWEFVRHLTIETGCQLLLDVNNVYVSSVNHDFDPMDYLDSIPVDRVVQFHLAGHTDLGTHCIDTHDGEVVDNVWELFRYAYLRGVRASTLLEWDASIPEFDVVHAEVLKAKDYLATAQGEPKQPAGRELVNNLRDKLQASSNSQVRTDNSRLRNEHHGPIPQPALFTTAEVE